jgi:hypothetical protein
VKNCRLVALARTMGAYTIGWSPAGTSSRSRIRCRCGPEVGLRLFFHIGKTSGPGYVPQRRGATEAEPYLS